eukprot:3511467-Pleurochrysis_carterae.AAC.2
MISAISFRPARDVASPVRRRHDADRPVADAGAHRGDGGREAGACAPGTITPAVRERGPRAGTRTPSDERAS